VRLEIRIFDDNDQIVAEYKGDPSQPYVWKAQAGQRLTSKMPAQSDNPNTGTYEYYGFSYQPHLHVDRPNGYIAPIPGPQNGLPSANQFPGYVSGPAKSVTGLPDLSSIYFKQKWGVSAPTATPAQGGSPASNLTQRG
jgi:hypothetical protein